MNWSDERYVRLYTRDTVTWKRWKWETRAVLGLLLRKVDRAGVLDTGRNGKVEAFALLLEVPVAVAEGAVSELISSGTLVESETGYLLPSFIDAQEAPQSDAVRQRESREKRRVANMRNGKGARHEVSQPVTPSHAASQPVTPPSLPSFRAVPSVPCLPSQPEEKNSSSPVEQPRAGESEDQNSKWLIEADAFIDWAHQQAPEIGEAGPPVRAWAQAFFLKYQPSNIELPRLAFVKFLTWVSLKQLKLGWGLWLQDKVWQTRWDDVRAEAARRGVG